MDIVEVILWIRPRFVDVIDFKASVRGDEVWLDRRYVYACHLGGWVVIREIANERLELDQEDRARGVNTCCLTLPMRLCHSQHRGRAIASGVLSEPDRIHLTGLRVLKSGGELTSGSLIGASLSPSMITVYIWWLFCRG